MSKRASVRVSNALVLRPPRAPAPPARTIAARAQAAAEPRFEVDKILRSRLSGARLHLFVSWVGFGSKDNSWISRDALDNDAHGHCKMYSDFERSRRQGCKEIEKMVGGLAKGIVGVGHCIKKEMAKVAKVAFSHESTAAFPHAKYATDKRQVFVGCPKFMFDQLPLPKKYFKKTSSGYTFSCGSDIHAWLNGMSSTERTDVGELREPSLYMPWEPNSSTRYTVGAKGIDQHGNVVYSICRLPPSRNGAARLKLFQGGEIDASYVHLAENDPDIVITDPIEVACIGNGMLRVKFCVVAVDLENDDYISQDEDDPNGPPCSMPCLALPCAA
jgi:hypothetical protein